MSVFFAFPLSKENKFKPYFASARQKHRNLYLAVYWSNLDAVSYMYHWRSNLDMRPLNYNRTHLIWLEREGLLKTSSILLNHLLANTPTTLAISYLDFATIFHDLKKLLNLINSTYSFLESCVESYHSATMWVRQLRRNTSKLMRDEL